ncbi:MAG: hypothetical protein AAF549_02255 [Pseudomonadota bacterium]
MTKNGSSHKQNFLKSLMPISYHDNEATSSDPTRFMIIHVDTNQIMKSWKTSLFSFEWLNKDGSIKDQNDLSTSLAEKYQSLSQSIEEGKSLTRPVLGVGLMDNVEIGSARDVFLTLAKHDIHSIEVHILKNDQDFFKYYEAR